MIQTRKDPLDGTTGRLGTDRGKAIIPAIIRRSIIAIGLVAALAGGPAVAFDKFLALGTSSSGGVYWPVGQSICKFINASRIEHLVRCLAYNTGGSVYNIQALTSGELDVAIFTGADMTDSNMASNIEDRADFCGATMSDGKAGKCPGKTWN